MLSAAFDVTISVLHKYFCPHCVHTPATPLSQQLQHSHVLILYFSAQPSLDILRLGRIVAFSTIFLQGIKQPSLRVNRELKSLMADDLVPEAPLPAGPTEDPSSPLAAPSGEAATPAAAAAAPVDLPAAVTAAASNIALGRSHASPDRRAKSDKSHGSRQQDTAAAQDTMQSPMLSGEHNQFPYLM